MAIKKRKVKRSIKITLYAIVLLLVLGVFWLEISMGKKSMKNKSIPYSKESKINYITYLKDNSHYDDSYLKDEYNLVASLIDYFNVDYNYTYTLGEEINYKLNYEITAVLEIYDNDNDAKPIEKKNYTLLKKQTKEGNGQIIKVDLFNQKIKYDYYNAIVQDWKKEISPNANLKISVKVNWTGHSNKLNKDISDDCVNEFIIPISQKTIDITPPNNVSETGVLKAKEKFSKKFVLLISCTLALFATGFIYFVVYISTSGKNKSKYDQKVSKILREFDRAITEAKGEFVMYDDENYIEVKSFMELLDVHDNLNEPIIHYANNEDLSVFVIKNGKDTSYTTLNRSDFDD